MKHHPQHSAPFYPSSQLVPRSYDVGILFCVRAVNLAWKDVVRSKADQLICQWILQRVCYFHTVTDEGPNPRRTCPTDVEMQPLRDTSMSVSPQRSSQCGHASSYCAPQPQHLQPSTAVDFSVLPQDGTGLQTVDVSRISMMESAVDATPQSMAAKSLYRLEQTAARSFMSRWSALKSGYSGPTSTDRHSAVSPVAAGPVPMPQMGLARSPFHNKGFLVVQELLLLCMDIDETVFSAMMQAFIAVLPRPTTTHAEISLAIFENYPYVSVGRGAKAQASATDPPAADLIVQQAENAAGNSIKSFSVYMSIMFHAASFERQCEILEMCKKWRQWIQESYGTLVSSSTAYPLQQQEASPSSPDVPAEREKWIAARTWLQEIAKEESSLVVEEMIREALHSKDVHAVANTIHRFYEHRLGADGTGKAMLELLVHPTQAPPPPSHPLAFLFGVAPTAASAAARTSPQSAPGASADVANAAASGHGAADVHSAISCAILTFTVFYLSMRSTAPALRCAEMAVLNGHQSGFTETLALAHLLRSRCHCAAGKIGAAAEDVSIALQLAGPQTSNGASQPVQEWWSARALAFFAAAELLIFYPGSVDAGLRAALMQTPLKALESAECTRGKDVGSPRRGNLFASAADNNINNGSGPSAAAATVEVVQTLAQTVRHVLWCAQVALLEESVGLAFQSVGSVLQDTLFTTASCLGISCAPPAATLEEQLSKNLALLEEDKIVMPLNRILSTSSSILLEYARRSVMETAHHLTGEYRSSHPNPLMRLHHLLTLVSERDGTTELLDRHFFFSLAVNIAAAHTLWSRGFATLALSLASPALQLLIASGGADRPPDRALHWPPEGLALLCSVCSLLVDIQTFLGDVESSRRVVEALRSVSALTQFVKGVLFSKLLEAAILQASRNRSAQVQLLEPAVRDAAAIGYGPLAAILQAKLIAAHLAINDQTAARKEWENLTHVQRCWLRRSASLQIQVGVVDAMLSDNPHQIRCLGIDVIVEHRSRSIPLLLELSASKTLLSLNVIPDDLAEPLRTVSSTALQLLRERRNETCMLGLGDSLVTTCNTVLALVDDDARGCVSFVPSVHR